MLNKKCPVCEGATKIKIENYQSGQINAKTGGEIVVPNVKIFHCTNEECAHSWLPHEEEEKIDQFIERERRHHLDPAQITLIRESLGFDTKADAANFLDLNSKAFIKWENANTPPSSAIDLLLRLAIFNRKNFEFIKCLHQKQFLFEEADYELICERKKLEWSFKALGQHHSTNESISYVNQEIKNSSAETFSQNDNEWAKAG